MEVSEQTKLKKIIKREREKKSKRHKLLYREAYAYLEKFPSSTKWLTKIKSESTKKRYAKLLFKYCAEVGFNPDELIMLKLEGMRKAGTMKEWVAEDTLEKYLERAQMKYNGKLMLKHAVISFYKKNRRQLAHDTAEKYEQLDKDPESYNMPSIDDLEEMGKNATTRNEALEWFIESTAMRRGTVANCTWGMLREVRHLENGETVFVSIFEQDKKGKLDAVVPLYIGVSSKYLKGKYKGVAQHSFVHFYAYEKLMAYRKWLRERGIEVSEDTSLFLVYRKPHRGISGMHACS